MSWLIFYNHLLVIIFFFVAGLTIVGITHIYQTKNAKVPLRWGALLIALGLLAFLYSYIGRPNLLEEQVATVRNFFIIVSGVGANLLASAAMANSVRRDAPLVTPIQPDHPAGDEQD